ncbi:MAG TPA: thioredoxin domain-containing protein [Gemmatimonadaceae bacterium]|nr:thioredoxin domain-containing protein [Gemmatimonadaceae bacterium]
MANLVNLCAAAAATAIIACSPSQSAPVANSSAATSAPSAPASTAAQSAQTPSDPLVVAADKGRIEGDANAKTWLIVASDFQCPFCKQWHDESYKTIVDEYVRTGKIKVAYVNYPLGQHQNAVPTAEAAMCASAQGKFWQYHDVLFATQNRWETMPMPAMVLDSIAGVVGLDKAAWKKCLESGKMKPLIMADRDRAAAAGVQSTPTFMLGDRLMQGTQPLAVMRAALDSEIAKNK